MDDASPCQHTKYEGCDPCVHDGIRYRTALELMVSSTTLSAHQAREIARIALGYAG